MLGILILSTGGLGFTGLAATLAAGLEAPAQVTGAGLTSPRLDLRIRVDGIGRAREEMDRAIVCVVDLTEPLLHLREVHPSRRCTVTLGEATTLPVPAGRPLGVAVLSPILGLERKSRGFMEALLPIDAVVAHSDVGGDPLAITLPVARPTGVIRLVPVDELRSKGRPAVHVIVSCPKTGLVVEVGSLFPFREPPGAEFELPMGHYRVAAEPHNPGGCSDTLALNRPTPAHRTQVLCLPGATTSGTIERIDDAGLDAWQAPAVRVSWRRP